MERKKKKVQVKSRKSKGRSIHPKIEAGHEYYFNAKENKDVFNRADESMTRMMKNHSIPRHKVGVK